ncbi:hypothetical protein AALA13_15950 [Lachnospiraceae bacterium 50-23]
MMMAPWNDYIRMRKNRTTDKKLLMKLHEAEEVVKDGEGWLSLDELKVLVMAAANNQALT